MLSSYLVKFLQLFSIGEEKRNSRESLIEKQLISKMTYGNDQSNSFAKSFQQLRMKVNLRIRFHFKFGI